MKDRERWRSLVTLTDKSPSDFQKWVDLVHFVDNLKLNKLSLAEDLQALRSAYEGLLKRFPLMELYWIKYAEWEFNLGYTEKAELVFERASTFCRASHQLWARFAKFMVRTCVDGDRLSQFFNRAKGIIGHHFLAHDFWDVYIECANSKEEEMRRILEVVEIPIHQHTKYYLRLVELSQQLPLDNCISEYYAVMLQEGPRKDISDLRNTIMAIHNQRYCEVDTLVHLKFKYEREILRVYHHIVYLDEADVANWTRYLDFEEVAGNMESIIMLYERCLIPMASYEKMWMRYVRFLLHHNLVDRARDALRRASALLPSGYIKLRLYFARLEETKGNVDLAESMYNELLKRYSESAELLIAFARFKVRTSTSRESAISLLEDSLIANATRQKASVVAALADLCLERDNNDSSNARDLFRECTQFLADDYSFWFYYLSFEMKQRNTNGVLETFSLFQKLADLCPGQKSHLIDHYVQYLLNYGDQSSSKQVVTILNLFGENEREGPEVTAVDYSSLARPSVKVKISPNENLPSEIAHTQVTERIPPEQNDNETHGKSLRRKTRKRTVK